MNFTKREGECTEGVFWDCVAEIGWPVKSATLTKAAILRAWTPEFGTSFRKIMEEKVSQVYKVFQEYEKQDLSERQRGQYYLSDDGISDFTNHVVGLGKTVFEEELADPIKLFERACNSDYQESFSYAVPYEPIGAGQSFEQWCERQGYDLDEENFSPHYMDERSYEEYVASVRESYMGSVRGDWRKVEPDHYAKWSEQLLPDTAAFLAALEATTVEDEQMAVEFASVLLRYLNLLVNEKTKEALELSEDALRAWWSLYHIATEIKALRSAHAELLPMCGNATYSGENLINDHRQYMGGLCGFKCQFHLHEIREKVKNAS